MLVIVAFFVGALVDHLIGRRWIDHRWWCGHWHRASHPCQPTPENLESWKRTEDRLKRAEDLDFEAKRLRRYF